MTGGGVRHEGMPQPKNDEAEVRTTQLTIAGMSCDACARHVSRALNALSGVVHVDVDLGNKEAVVEHLSGDVDAAALVEAVRAAGYTADVVRAALDAERSERHEAPAACGCGCCGDGKNAARIG